MNAERLEQDLELMSRAAAGDLAARKAVIRRLMNRVRNVARALITDPFDVDDSVQTTLLEVLSSAGAYKGQSPLEAWSDRIAIRVAMRVVRERNKRTARTHTALQPDELEARSRQLSLPDIPRKLQDYLDELPDDRRTVLVLRHVLEYSIEEIAELTHASKNTVKDRLLRARQEIRRRIRRDRVTGVQRLRKSG